MTYSEPASVISIIFSLVITIVAYCFFPLLYAYCENEPISKIKYRFICFGFNFIIAVLFQLFSSSNGLPYWLWTSVFSSVGIKMLDKKGLMADSNQSSQEAPENIPSSDLGNVVKEQVIDSPTTADCDHHVSTPSSVSTESKPIKEVTNQANDSLSYNLSVQDPSTVFTEQKNEAVAAISAANIDDHKVPTQESIGTEPLYENSPIAPPTAPPTNNAAESSAFVPHFYDPSSHLDASFNKTQFSEPVNNKVKVTFNQKSSSFDTGQSIPSGAENTSNNNSGSSLSVGKTRPSKKILNISFALLLVVEAIALTVAFILLSSQKSKIAILEEKSQDYSTICDILSGSNFRNGSSVFKVSSNHIVISKSQQGRQITLSTLWDSAGTVDISYSGDSARLDFNVDEWDTYVTLTIVPQEEGITLATFSNTYNSDKIDVLIIVTE